MENLTFKTFFFRLYDRKIAEGSITFSQIGMSKNDFTKLCTEPDFVPDIETIERVCLAMRLTEEEEVLLRRGSIGISCGAAESYGITRPT